MHEGGPNRRAKMPVGDTGHVKIRRMVEFGGSRLAAARAQTSFSRGIALDHRCSCRARGPGRSSDTDANMRRTLGPPFR